MGNSNIRPRHSSFQTFESDSSHDTYYNFYDSDERAYQDFQTFESTSAHATYKESGYQYVASTITASTIPFEELITMTDNWVIRVRNLFDERIVIQDGTFTGKKRFEDTFTLIDSWIIKVRNSFADTITLVDTLNPIRSFLDNLPILDSWVIKAKRVFSDNVVLQDVMDRIMTVSTSFGIKVGISKEHTDSYTNKIEVSGWVNDSYTINPVIMNFSLPPVTQTLASETDPEAPPTQVAENNPFQPTVSIEGSLVVESPNTTFSPPANGIYRNLDNTGISGVTYCNLYGSGLRLDYAGGSWTVASKDPLTGSTNPTAILGQAINIFGFTGTIENWGAARGPQQREYITSGIFGSPTMQKPFSLVSSGSGQYLQFMNTASYFNLPNPSTFTTVKGVAQIIAAAAGVNLSWTCTDAPYKDPIGQTGQTALGALSTLASQVGGTLRWNGTNSYIVAYPTFTAGVWNLLDARLIQSFSYTYHMDLGLGVTGSGVLGIPVNQFYSNTPKQLPAAEGAGSTAGGLEVIENINTAITPSMPTKLRDLPNDTEKILYQFLFKSVADMGAGAGQTVNPQVWFELANFALGPNSSPYIGIQSVDGAQRKRLLISSSLFPTGSKGINSGNFWLNIAITRKSQDIQYNQQKAEAEQSFRDLVAQIQANVRFIKTFSATITVLFYGSIPIPGMSTSFTWCGETVTGIIESVSLQNGVLTIELAQYARINLIDGKLNWDLAHATPGT